MRVPGCPGRLRPGRRHPAHLQLGDLSVDAVQLAMRAALDRNAHAAPWERLELATLPA